MNLYEHQDEFLKLLPDKHLLCWDMGTGKTRTAIEWAKLRGGRTLAVVPKGLQKNWLRECEKWNLRLDIISKENFKKKFRELGGYKNLIIDEGHYFAGASQMNKVMHSYCNSQPEMGITILTGTPYLRNAWNVYRLGGILGKKWNYRQFEYTFFTQVHMGYRVVPIQKDDDATKKLLATYVNSIGSTKHLSECADVPISTEYMEEVQVTKEQVEAVSQLTDFEPLVRFTKEQQIMSGHLIPTEFEDGQIIKSAKRDKLVELVNQNLKVMVVCRYNYELEQLRELFVRASRTVFVLNGAVSNRDEVIQQARKADECVLLVGAMISEGWEIPEIETMIFYSHSFSLKDYLQMKGRVQRMNDLRPRCYIHLIVKDSVDVGIYDCLMNKKDFLAQIYAQKGSRNYRPS